MERKKISCECWCAWIILSGVEGERLPSRMVSRLLDTHYDNESAIMLVKVSQGYRCLICESVADYLSRKKGNK